MSEEHKPGTTMSRRERAQKLVDAEAELWPRLDTALAYASFPEQFATELTKAMETAVEYVVAAHPIVTGRQAHPERVTRLKGTTKAVAGRPDKYAERMAALAAIDDAFMDLFDELAAAGDAVSQEVLNGFCAELISVACDAFKMARPLYAPVDVADDPLLTPKENTR